MPDSMQPGFTTPPSAPGQVESRSSKTALDLHLASLDRDKRPPWEALWRALMDERVIGEDGRPRPRWDWRKALYIAWRCTPASVREPQTLQELATDYLGLHDTATIRHWRAKDPEIEQRIAELPRELLMSHLSSVYAALAIVAGNPDPRCFQDRRLFLEITGEYKPSGKLDLDGQLGLEHSGDVGVHYDLSKFTDEELAQLETLTAKLAGGAD